MSPNPHLPVAVVESRGAYTFAALTHPLSAMSMLMGIGAGFCLGGAVLACGMFAITIGAVRWLAASASFRRSVDGAAHRKRLTQRRNAWHARLEQEAAHGARDALVELIALVEEIERTAPGLAQRFELEALVDAWVHMAIAHERTVARLRTIKRDELVGHLELDRRRASQAAAMRCDILRRRIAAWDQCRNTADRMADEMVATLELVRLLAQRGAQADAPDKLDALRHVLVQLDDEDDALRSLARAAG
jgi:hypothetical protein